MRKLGDKVKIKSLTWYNENKDRYGQITVRFAETFHDEMSEFCGKEYIISKIYSDESSVYTDSYELSGDINLDDWYFSDYMFEN